jgi:hypothetical protein
VSYFIDFPIFVPDVRAFLTGADDWGLFLDTAAVVLPIVLAVVGVIVSTIHLETPASKFWWRSGVVVLGFVASFVAYQQQKVARYNAEKSTKEQVEVAKQEQTARYVPAGVLVYDNKQFKFYNKTKSSLYFWGDKIADTPKAIEPVPRIIPIDAYYYILGDEFERRTIQIIGQNGEDRISFEMYFKNELAVKYTAVFILLILVKDGNVQVHTQMTSFDKSDW